MTLKSSFRGSCHYVLLLLALHKPDSINTISVCCVVQRGREGRNLSVINVLDRWATGVPYTHTTVRWSTDEVTTRPTNQILKRFSYCRTSFNRLSIKRPHNIKWLHKQVQNYLLRKDIPLLNGHLHEAAVATQRAVPKIIFCTYYLLHLLNGWTAWLTWLNCVLRFPCLQTLLVGICEGYAVGLASLPLLSTLKSQREGSARRVFKKS